MSDVEDATPGSAEAAVAAGPDADLIAETLALIDAEEREGRDDHDALLDDEERVGADDVVGDYGVDQPGLVNGVSWAAGIAFFITLVTAVANALPLMLLALAFTIVLTFAALSLVWSSRVGKLRERVLIVDTLELSGNERVLDVGCGRGLLMVEVGHRLDDGSVVGVDVWRDEDQSGNEPTVALTNAEIEQVDDVTTVVTGDARLLPFESESFDAVVSNMALHNIADFDGRVNAIREIDRILAPGGRFVVVDLQATREYGDALHACDWTDVTRSRRIWRMFPPVHYVIGTKPDGEVIEEPVVEDPADEQPVDANAVVADGGDADDAGEAPLAATLTRRERRSQRRGWWPWRGRSETTDAPAPDSGGDDESGATAATDQDADGDAVVAESDDLMWAPPATATAPDADAVEEKVTET